MKALIVLENHFYKDNDGIVWCDRIIDYNFLKRYLSVFENIVVAGRCEKIEENIGVKLLVSGKNIEFIELPEFIGAKGLIKNIYKIRKILRKAIRDTNCTIYRAPTHISLFTYKEVLKEHKPLALEFMMAADKMIDGKNIIKILINKLIKLKAKKMCLKANGVSYVTERILQKDYPCKAIIDGESNDFFTSSYSTIDLEEEDFYKRNWEIDEKPEVFKIIHTGYMDSYRKGQDVLIKAVKEVKKAGYNVELILIGDGKKKEEFEKLACKLQIEDIVKFKGLIKDKKEIIDNLRKAHILVFPTQSEGLPRTIIEAMAQGLPCISSPVDGIPELLDDEFLIDYTNYKAYADKIIELITNWEKMKKISLQNYEKSQKYKKEVLMNKRKEFYKKLKRMAEYETKEK